MTDTTKTIFGKAMKRENERKDLVMKELKELGFDSRQVLVVMSIILREKLLSGKFNNELANDTRKVLVDGEGIKQEE